MAHTFYVHECLNCLGTFKSGNLIYYSGCPYCGSRQIRVIHTEDCHGDRFDRPLVERGEED